MKMGRHIKVFWLLAILLLLSSSFGKNIGVTWVGKSNMAKQVNAGLVEELKVIIPGVQIEYKIELQTLNELKTVVQSWDKTKDAIVVLRSNGAQWLGENPTKKPAFIGGCNHPGHLGAVESMRQPGKNITGVTYYIPAELQFQVLLEVVPNVKSLLLLTEKGHPSSRVDIFETREVAQKYDIQVDYHEANSRKEIKKIIETHRDKVGAIIMGNQALIFDNTEVIVAAAESTPIFTYARGPVFEGALGGFVVDDQKLGALLAQSIQEVLILGSDPSKVAIKTDKEPVILFNGTMLKKHNINIPQSLKKRARIIE